MKEKIEKMTDAVTSGDLETVKKLLEETPNLLYETTFLGSWLHRAAARGQLEVAQYLIDKGCDVNKIAGIGEAGPINSAILSGEYEMVKLLVKNNAIFDTSTVLRNPLFDAISNKEFEIAKYLVDQGIDLSATYKLYNIEQNAYIYSKGYGAEELAEYILQKMKEKNIPMLEEKEKKKRIYNKNQKANFEKNVLKEMFTDAIQKTVVESLKKHKKELVYAMCFNIFYDAYEPEERYQCEVYLQTKEAYKRAGDEEDIIDAMYIPDEYEYVEDINERFVEISDYLFQNCINVEECNQITDAKKQEEQEREIIKQNCEIERILAETIGELRTTGLFKNKKGEEIYVYPYPREEDEDEQKVFIENAKIMNKGMELDGFIEYLF